MKKDNLIFIHKLLKAIADSIISVFIPLYILKMTNDVRLSMGYLVIYSIFVMILMRLLKKLLEKHGILMIMLHFIPIIASEAIFSFVGVNLYTVLSVAFLMAINQTFYSIPLNITFATLDKKTNVGKFQISTNAGKIIFTLISGFILSSAIKNSFLILSIASFIFYIGSSIPILFCYKELKAQYSKTNRREEERPKVDKMFILFHILFGIFQPIMDNVIPQYLYVNSLSFSAVTVIIVLIEVLKMASNYLSQFLVQKKKALTICGISFLLFFVSAIGMILIKQNLVLYILSCTCSVSFPMTFVPMFGIYCRYLKKSQNIAEGLYRRDMDIFSFRPLMYSLSMIGVGFYPSILLGILVVPFMFTNEYKILEKYEKDE